MTGVQTCALPISTMGVETSIIPTAVLSTHTMFDNFTFRDLTEDMNGIKKHFISEGFQFDAVYTGYLGSKEQINIVMDYFDTFRSKDNYIIVDPAMADNGKLYTGFTPDFALEMAKLCSKADVVLPNISEACFMLGRDYIGEDAAPNEVKELLTELTSLGAKTVVITGVRFGKNDFGFMGYDTRTEGFFQYSTEEIPMKSHGTGDIFASTFTGALMNNYTVYNALKIAADYTCACIKNTYNDPVAVNYGVNFEAEIPLLLKMIGK